MGLYDGIKDLAKVVQQADNIELYRQLLDLGKQALDLQAEVLQLQEENAKLKKLRELEELIERHEEPVITRKDDRISIFYCAHCWENEGKLFQVSCSDNGMFCCPHCKNSDVYDRKKAEAYEREIENGQFIY